MVPNATPHRPHQLSLPYGDRASHSSRREQVIYGDHPSYGNYICICKRYHFSCRFYTNFEGMKLKLSLEVHVHAWPMDLISFLPFALGQSVSIACAKSIKLTTSGIYQQNGMISCSESFPPSNCKANQVRNVSDLVISTERTKLEINLTNEVILTEIRESS